MNESVEIPNETVRRVTNLIQSLGMALHIGIERSAIQRATTLTRPEGGIPTEDSIKLWLARIASAFRMRLAPVDVSYSDAMNLLADGFVLIAVDPSDTPSPWWVLESKGKGGVAAIEMGEDVEHHLLRSRQVRELFSDSSSFLWFIAQPELLREVGISPHAIPASAAFTHDATEHLNHQVSHHASQPHATPLQRFSSLLRLESGDLFSIFMFSFVSVILGLATPLTIEILVNTIGFGRSFQPILVLSMVLLIILFLSSAFKLLQIIVVELLQRRLFVRLVGDLAHRIPNVNYSAIEGIHGPELLNRYFDIMTLQKSTAHLLLDGVTIVMQTLIGTLLLAFYHPYLLGFDIVLILCMTIITYFLGRGGVRSAIDESRIKYSIAHWLQDVVASPSVFKLHSGADFCVDRANRLTVEYLVARRRHFSILVRQIIFALLLLPLALTSLYALGGYLVISNQLTLGQLVAAELVVAVIVGAFAKAWKSIETFYDLMSATEKVGHLLDLEVDPPAVAVESQSGPVAVRVEDLHVHDGITGKLIDVGSFLAAAGERVAIAGTIGSSDAMVLPAIAGLKDPDGGFIEIGGLAARDALRFSDGALVGYAGPNQFFAGTITENLRLGRTSITDMELRNALEFVEMWDELLRLPKALETRIQTGGFPLADDQLPRLTIARAIVVEPRVLLIDWALDALPRELRYRIWNRLRDPGRHWTLLVTTHDETIIRQADKEFRIDGKR